MANMLLAFNKLMELEGGGKYHVVEGDPGGATKWGVSQRAHPDVDIKNLTKLDALGIFEADYWAPIRGHDIENDQIAFEIAELTFHTNSLVAVIAAQTAHNDLMRAAGARGRHLHDDGIIGPKTIAALNRLHRMGGVMVFAWVSRFNLLQLRHYRSLRRGLVQRFFVGWTRRVIE